MRTIFTNEDVKNLIEEIFNGNLRQSQASNGEIKYENPNSEKVSFIREEDIDNSTPPNVYYEGSEYAKDLAEYLNIHFYAWKDRLVESGNTEISQSPELSVFDEWVESLNYSMDKSYALVEILDEEATPSQDIDNGVIQGKVTFIMQTNKISNLDYYVSKIRNAYFGNAQDYENIYGEKLKMYFLMGRLLYDQEPTTMQLGECVIVSFNFVISYLLSAGTYQDTKVEISLDGDDEYDDRGQIIGETKYLTMPITKMTWQNVFTSNAVPTSERPDLTGFLATSLTNVKTLSFFDYDKELTQKFNDLFWKCGAYRVNGKKSLVMDVNIPVYIKVTNNGKTYVYKDIIDNMEKVLTNSDFNICSITLKGWGKVENEIL